MSFASLVNLNRVVYRSCATTTDHAHEEPAEQSKALQRANAEQVTSLQWERNLLIAKVTNLRSALQYAESAANTSQVGILELELRGKWCVMATAIWG